MAFLVEEWRNIEGSWRRLGHVTRDMQIIITGQQNQRPDFTLPQDMVITDSQPIDETITFLDPDGDPIKVEFFGDVFDLPGNPMMVSPVPGDFTGGPLSFRFQWTPLAEQVRDRPYFVHLKITDQPTDPIQNPAVTYKTWILSFSELPDVITVLLDEPVKPAIVLYPNPTKGRLAWTLDEYPEKGNLILYNSLGQRTISLDLTSNGVREIDISQFQAGVYFAELKIGKQTYRQSFIKE